MLSKVQKGGLCRGDCGFLSWREFCVVDRRNEIRAGNPHDARKNLWNVDLEVRVDVVVGCCVSDSQCTG